MPKPDQSIKDKYYELTEKVEKLKASCSELAGKQKELIKNRNECLDSLKALGVEDPHDPDKLQKHIVTRKKKLSSAIDKKISEVEAAIDKLEGEE